MGNSISSNWMKFYDENILAFFQSLKDNPFSLFTAILDLAIVIFLLYAFFQNNQHSNVIFSHLSVDYSFLLDIKAKSKALTLLLLPHT